MISIYVHLKKSAAYSANEADDWLPTACVDDSTLVDFEGLLSTQGGGGGELSVDTYISISMYI